MRTRRALGAGAAALALAASLNGCGVFAGVMSGPVAAEPNNPDRVGPAILVAAGTGPGGEYRAWVYRTKDGSTCFEVAASGGGGAGCSSDVSGVVGPSVSTTNKATLVSGGTAAPDAMSVVIHSNQADVTAPLSGAAGALIPGVKVFAVALGAGATPTTIDVLDGDGKVLVTEDLDGG